MVRLGTAVLPSAPNRPYATRGPAAERSERVKTISELLGAYKAAHDLTDTDLAQQLGVSQSTASSWVAGRVIPDDSRLLTISKVIGAKMEDLQQATWAARRSRAQSLDELVAMVTQLQVEIGRLAARVAALEAPAPRAGKSSDGKRR